jgi:hypothetical protein
LCDQLRRIASLTIDDSGHISDPDVLYHHIERHITEMAAALEDERARWQSILADAQGLAVVDGNERHDLVAWLERHAADAPSEGID